MALLAHKIDEKQRTEDVILNENITFQSLLLSQNILSGLTKCGFRKPSPIQFKSIPLGRCGFDLVIKSKSGTGKTAVFGVITLEMVNSTKNDLQALILAPTREIAVQIQDVLRDIGSDIKGLKVECFIGGSPEKEDISKAKDCHIAVGAPGRVKALINQKILQTQNVRLFVLDEADKLMEDSFQDDINEIYYSLPERKQMIASSATYPDKLDEFLSTYMLSPTQVSAEINTPLLLGLKQFVKVVKWSPNLAILMGSKTEALLEILANVSFTQCLVFTNYQTRAESVSNMINQKDWSSSFISAAQSQKQRLKAVNDLKEFKCRILLSTDLTARGIDAANVDLVINYDVPNDAMTYLHRMGRAGRYGSKGICITLASTGEELKLVKEIMGVIGGAGLNVPLLPLLKDKNLDIWKADEGQFEQITATLPDPNKNKESFKNIDANGLFEIKQSKKEKKSKQKHKPNAENSQNNDDAMDILTSLASGSFNFNEIPDKIKKVVKEETNNDSDDKKRKRISNESNQSGPIILPAKIPPKCNQQNIKKDLDPHTDRENIFIKNRALYQVAKILSGKSVKVDKEMEQNITEYIHLLNAKNKESIKDRLAQYENCSTSELLENIQKVVEQESQCETNQTNKEEVIKDTTIENIFEHAYNFAIENKIHWLSKLPEEDIDEFNKLSIAEPDEMDEDYYDVEEEYDDENNTEFDALHEDITKRWMPIEKKPRINKMEKTQTELVSVPMDEKFEAAFNHCSEYLWQYGLSCETVESFDNFFTKWQQQVHSVREYVRQNIYVKEMSEYQNKMSQ